MKLEPITPTRSVGVNLDEDLINAIDGLCDLMSKDGIPPSRSEVARSLLWSAIALVKNPDPRAAELLTLLRQEGEMTGQCI